MGAVTTMMMMLGNPQLPSPSPSPTPSITPSVTITPTPTPTPTPIPEYRLYAWGGNGSGQLGLNISSLEYRNSPVQVGTSTDWSSVIANTNQTSFAIKTNNALWGWGQNQTYNLGDGTYINKSSPVQIGSNVNDWVNIAGGNSHTLAINTGGKLFAWGWASYGQLGNNDYITTQKTPIQIGFLTTWSKVAAMNNNSLATKTDGTLWAWGRNLNGELGLGNTIAYSSPVQVGYGSSWSKIAGGSGGFLAIKTDGSLWAIGGTNSGGVLGLNDTIRRSSPVQVGSLTTWSKISVGIMALAIKTDGTLWSWGSNPSGNLGINNAIYRSSPVQVGSLTDWSTVAAGERHGLAIKTDGTLWSWGSGLNGRLGLGNTTTQSSPVQVGALTTWSGIAGGSTHSLAITKN